MVAIQRILDQPEVLCVMNDVGFKVQINPTPGKMVPCSILNTLHLEDFGSARGALFGDDHICIVCIFVCPK